EENLYGNLYGFISEVTDKGLYGKYRLEKYTKEEILELEKEIKPERDFLFTYSGINLLAKRYLIQDFDRSTLELPQEMFMGIAMHLAIPEKKEARVNWAKRFYDVLSSLKATMATPTMSNARKPFYQLSSCFIDTVEDSLKGIYKSLDNFAEVSKFGGGMGIYIGKIRALESPIRGFKGASGGVIPWVKLFNDTAIAVDQLGVRNGSVAIWLDASHKDLPEFLQLKTNNGDDRKKAHDVFPGLCYPDLFWKLAENDIDSNWYMMCPHEIRLIKG
ncbi:ribonucleoside-diphosphate reductase subunit alpha, partial [Clostridium perfringens]|uniref:ribonucleotide reductase N-terminal alpha domain-containing protein n=1 Tax=Clostridium perfringens TaxID=1502 RepID=UPI002AC74FDC